MSAKSGKAERCVAWTRMRHSRCISGCVAFPTRRQPRRAAGQAELSKSRSERAACSEVGGQKGPDDPAHRGSAYADLRTGVSCTVRLATFSEARSRPSVSAVPVSSFFSSFRA